MAQNIDIARKDFPISRRGYDTASVDGHLERLEEKLRQESDRERVPLAAGISEQVKSILAAAESAAVEMRDDAERASEQMRSAAAAESRQHVTRISDSSATLLSELASLRGRAHELLEEIEANSGALKDGLLSLREDVSTFRGQAASDASPQGATAGRAADVNFEDASAVLDEARAVASKMAQDGASSEEINHHLEENYELPDRARLVTEVIAEVR